MRTKKLILTLALVVAAIAAFTLLRRSRDTLESPPEIASRLWIDGSEDDAVLVHLIEEQRRRTVGTGRSSMVTRTILYSRYILIARKLSDGGVVGRITLGEIKRNDPRPKPELLGIAGGRAWLWDRQLTAYSLPDLSLSFSNESWGPRAAAVTELLPPSADGFRITPDRSHLAFRGRDARMYRVDGDAGDIAVIDPELFPPTTLSRQAEDRFVHYRPPQMSRTATSLSNLMQKSFRKQDGYWYALLSESELKNLGRWAMTDDRPYGEVARSFYRLPYQWDGRSAEIDTTRTEPLGDVRLIQAGFLEREYWQVWNVPDPASTLALARPRLGADVPWDLVRLAHDGRIIWRTTTGLADLYGYLPTERAVVMIGQRLPTSVAGPKSDRREYVVVIDTATGQSHEFDAGDAD